MLDKERVARVEVIDTHLFEPHNEESGIIFQLEPAGTNNTEKTKALHLLVNTLCVTCPFNEMQESNSILTDFIVCTGFDIGNKSPDKATINAMRSASYIRENQEKIAAQTNCHVALPMEPSEEIESK